MLYTLPVSLFGMSVSAAELPAMSSAAGHARPSGRRSSGPGSTAGLRQIAFFVVPSAVAFLALGDVVAGALYQTGDFTRAMTVYVWGILAGSAVGLLAVHDGPALRVRRSTRCTTPARRSASPLLRVALTIGLGYLLRPAAPAARSGIDPRWGAAGLTASAGIAGWVEFLLLRRALNRRIGPTGLPARLAGRSSGARRVAAAAARWAVRLALPAAPPLAAGARGPDRVRGGVFSGDRPPRRVRRRGP